MLNVKVKVKNEGERGQRKEQVEEEKKEKIGEKLENKIKWERNRRK